MKTALSTITAISVIAHLAKDLSQVTWMKTKLQKISTKCLKITDSKPLKKVEKCLSSLKDSVQNKDNSELTHPLQTSNMDSQPLELKTEAQFNTWIRRNFYESANGKVVVQRIENTTSNGVPDFLVILQNRILLIESKFETGKVRPEQSAFQIKTNEIIKESVNKCITLTAYPKTNRFVMRRFDASCIDDSGIEDPCPVTFSLTKEGFNDFYKYVTL